MDYWNIIPYAGVGVLRFGTSRSEARSLLNNTPPSTFRRGPYAAADSDAYNDISLHLDYDFDDHLQCIMAFGSCPIFYENTSFLNRPLRDVLADLAKVGLSSQYDDEGYWFHDAGFVLYAPDNIVKAVTVYRKGYYEEEIDVASKV
jgi:hypothetical protein